MPAYDPSLDEKLFTKSWESDSSRISVSVHSYNKGTKKVQISRENKTSDDDYRFAKLGRLTKEELEAIIPFIQEAVQNMD